MKKIIKILLIGGILSSLFYIGSDIIAAALYPGYNYADQQVSELSAIDAPTRPFWIAMGRVYAVLTIGFGMGVWLSAGQKRSLKIAGILIIAFAILGQFWPPMHQRGTNGLSETTDVMHIVFAGMEVSLMILFISFGAAAFKRGFGVYSILTIAAMLGFGALTGTQVSAIAAGQPTPWMGLVERVSVYAPLVWIIVLAVNLFYHNKKNS